VKYPGNNNTIKQKREKALGNWCLSNASPKKIKKMLKKLDFLIKKYVDFNMTIFLEIFLS